MSQKTKNLFLPDFEFKQELRSLGTNHTCNGDDKTACFCSYKYFPNYTSMEVYSERNILKRPKVDFPNKPPGGLHGKLRYIRK